MTETHQKYLWFPNKDSFLTFDTYDIGNYFSTDWPSLESLVSTSWQVLIFFNLLVFSLQIDSHSLTIHSHSPNLHAWVTSMLKWNFNSVTSQRVSRNLFEEVYLLINNYKFKYYLIATPLTVSVWVMEQTLIP
jgi:hypothetical protein